MFAEHRKEHGYFVLAVLRGVPNFDKKFHRVPSHRKGARLLCFDNLYCKDRELYFEQKTSVIFKGRTNLKEYFYG
jgi:hypothetical protein